MPLNISLFSKKPLVLFLGFENFSLERYKHTITPMLCTHLEDIPSVEEEIHSICLNLDAPHCPSKRCIRQRLKSINHPEVPILVRSHSQTLIETYLHYGVDDYYVGDTNSPLFELRLKHFIQGSFEKKFLLPTPLADQVDLAFMAFYDPLTGLANRKLFQERCKEKIRRYWQGQDPFSLLFVDLDNFKCINDNYSHRVGDLLLTEIAFRLKNAVKKRDLVARIGGDEFCILLDNVENEIVLQDIACRILYRLHLPFNIRNELIKITLSVGISRFPLNGTSLNTLLDSADQAMYQAKKLGKSGFCFASGSAFEATFFQSPDTVSVTD